MRHFADENVAPWMPSLPVLPPTTIMRLPACWMFETFIFIHYAYVAAEDERVGDVSVVEINRAVDGGYSHPVAVIADACDNAFHNSSWVQDALGDVFEFHIRVAEAEYVCIGDWSCAHTCPHRVAYNAAYACCGPAVRVECGWVIVRFDFEANCRFVVEIDDARVIGEDAYAPGLVQVLCGLENGLL